MNIVCCNECKRNCCLIKTDIDFDHHTKHEHNTTIESLLHREWGRCSRHSAVRRGCGSQAHSRGGHPAQRSCVCLALGCSGCK